jgi:hypothetical protein
MNLKTAAVFFLAMVCAGSFVSAQTTAPVPRSGSQRSTPFRTSTYAPTPEDLQSIKSKQDELNAAIAALKKSGADDDLVVDAESCAWMAGDVSTVPGGFIDQSYVNRCVTLLNDGLRRAQEIKDGKAAWPQLKGRVNRAYRSKVDGTAQPYHLSVPVSYDPSKPTPLYVYLHGRSQTDPDLGMGWAGGNDRAGGGAAGGGGGGNNYIRFEAFGRGNNSFRWAGEADVLEAIASVRHRYNIDPDRILLAGFSMGGAGSWQIGLHNPDMFCGLEVDAGVIGTRKNMDGLSPAQRAAQSTYGILIDHAVNVLDVPLVAYAGANDAQLLSSTSIREQLVREGYTIEQISTYVGKGKDINALFLANPGQGHSHATGETKALIDAFNAKSFENGRIVPDHIEFVTYTTRYNKDFWITIDGMGEHFQRASVDAQRDAAKANYTIHTANVSRLLIEDTGAAHSLTIDGDVLAVSAAPSILLEKDSSVPSGHWKTTSAANDVALGLRKHHNLQGPINDAYMDAFICVSPSGQPYSNATDAAAKQELSQFEKLFKRNYCGDTRTRPDTAVTEADIQNNNLILFGDPSSNLILAKIADQLPIKWTKESIIVGDKTYTAADHLPVLIYPNPLNPRRYVVINAGLTAGGGPNAPTAYGDYAVLKITQQDVGLMASEVAEGGVFNETWSLAGKR